jgi:predicted porin
MIALGYEHSLSKRTTLKAVYSQIKNEAAANYDFGINSVGNIGVGADPKGFQVGVRHSF